MTAIQPNATSGEGFRPSTPIPTAKFATINIIVPNTVIGLDVGGIFGPWNLMVSVGYSKEGAVASMVHPCGEWYSESRKQDIENLLDKQQ